MGRATVKTHLDHVFTKTGLHSRTELAAEYVRRHPSPSELKPPGISALPGVSGHIGPAPGLRGDRLGGGDRCHALSTLPSDLRRWRGSVPVVSPSAGCSNARCRREEVVTASPSW